MALVLCHGRKHAKIKQINYDQSVFIDLNEESEPDYLIDIASEDMQLLDRKFDVIIAAKCHHPATIDNPIIQNGYIFDGDLNEGFIDNLIFLLTDQGEFYTTSPFSNQLMINKMYVQGFEFVGYKDLTFSITYNFLVFKFVNRPDKFQLSMYINDLIRNRKDDLRVEFIAMKYFSENYGDYITDKIVVDNNFSISQHIRRKDWFNKNQKLDYNDLVKLKCYFADGTKLVLFNT